MTETEPPAYNDLYSRDNSQLDRLVVSGQGGINEFYQCHAADM